MVWVSSQQSAAREPLAFALGSPAKVAVLRTLAGIREPITQREVSRRSGVQNRSAQAALDDLVDLGLVTRQVGGREHLVSLNPRHRLEMSIRALFTRESEHFLQINTEIAGL